MRRMHCVVFLIIIMNLLLFIFKGYLDFRNVIFPILIINDVFGQGDCWFSRLLENKFDDNLPPNRIALFCTAVQRLHSCLSSSLIVKSTTCGPFFVCRDTKVSHRHPQGDSLTDERPFINLRKKSTTGGTLGVFPSELANLFLFCLPCSVLCFCS